MPLPSLDVRARNANALGTGTASPSKDEEDLLISIAEDNEDLQFPEVDKDKSKPKAIKLSKNVRRAGYVVGALLFVATIASIPHHDHNVRSASYVWWCGWLTAIATGLGAVPFYWMHNVNKFWLGVCNGLAAGMMLAATMCLFHEAWHVPHQEKYGVPVGYRTFVGAFIGILFIKFTKLYLDEYEDVEVAGLEGLDAKKALLIMAVMTLHSVSEGIGVGVSFGGDGGERRGHIITMTMAIHNIPEGVAIALTLVPRGMDVFFATLWCIASSLPQPVFAVPAFLFVEHFIAILPAGLGFAGGAMGFVALRELLPESLEDTKSVSATALATVSSFIVFLTLQTTLSDGM